MRQRRVQTTERVIVLVLALAALIGGFYFAVKSGTNPEAYSNDFNVYYHAAREVIAGRDPYQQSLGDWVPYLYPPLFAELITPLALLPLPVAAYLWFLISAASIAAAAWMSASLAFCKQERYDPEQHDTESSSQRIALAVCALLMVLRFVLDTFNLGQVNSVVAGLAVAHLYLYARDRKAWSAVALVLAVSIKLTPALLLIYHIAKLRLKYAVTCAALLSAITVVSFLPFGANGADAFRTFWSRTVENEQGFELAYSGNQSLRGAMARLIGYPNPDAVEIVGKSRYPADLPTLLVSLMFLALAVVVAVRARTSLAGAAPFFCCFALLSPLTWKAHYVILIAPVAHLLAVAKSSTKARRWVAATLGVAFVLMNLTGTRVVGLAAAEWADAHSLVFAGALLIFIASVATSRLPASR